MRRATGSAGENGVTAKKGITAKNGHPTLSRSGATL
jgi:hypothetical protein